MNRSPPGSVHGDCPDKITGVGCQAVLTTQGPSLSLLGLLHWQGDSLPLESAWETPMFYSRKGISSY